MFATLECSGNAQPRDQPPRRFRLVPQFLRGLAAVVISDLLCRREAERHENDDVQPAAPIRPRKSLFAATVQGSSRRFRRASGRRKQSNNHGLLAYGSSGQHVPSPY